MNAANVKELAAELWPKVRPFAMYAAWPLFALAVVAITIFASLPRDRIKDRIEATLSADPMSGTPGALGMDVQIGDVSLTLFSGAGVKVKDVVLRSRPTRPDEKPARYIVDDATVHVGVLGMLFNRPTYTFKAHALQGTVSGEIGLSPSEERFTIEAEGLQLGAAAGIQQSVGLPIDGTVGFKVQGVAAKQLMQNLEGSAELTIDGLVIGDGKAKLAVPGDPFLSQGITFPKLRLGNVIAKVTMMKGRANIEEFRVHSADGDASLDGFADLRDPLAQSLMHGFLKFRPSEGLVKREPTVELMNTALASAKRSDGYIGFQLSGPLSAVFYLPNQNPPPGVGSKNAPPPTAPSVPTIPSSPALPSTPTTALPGAPLPTATRVPTMPPPPPEPSANEGRDGREGSHEETPPPPAPAGNREPAVPVGGSPPGTGNSVTAPPPNPRVHTMEENAPPAEGAPAKGEEGGGAR